MPPSIDLSWNTIGNMPFPIDLSWGIIENMPLKAKGKSKTIYYICHCS